MFQRCSDELARANAFHLEKAVDRLCPHGLGKVGFQQEWYAVAKLTAASPRISSNCYNFNSALRSSVLTKPPPSATVIVGSCALMAWAIRNAA